MPLTPEEKAERQRQRMLEKAAQFQVSTYSRRFVAPVFQKMIRAEAAALPNGLAWAIVDGKLAFVPRRVGECVCVTCGTVGPWTSNTKTFNAGHFLAGRRNSILYEESNVAPQCVTCNCHRSGAAQEYRKWMMAVRGREVVERLERLKTQSVSFDRGQLVDMRIKYAARLDAAIRKMESEE